MRTDFDYFPRYLAAAATLMLILLSGCGGGGGGSTGGANAPPPVSADPGNLLTSLPTSSYAVDSGELKIFTDLNAIRGIEFGYLKQSPLLDTVATRHAVYLQRVATTPQIGPEGTQYMENGIPIVELGSVVTTIDPATGVLGAHVEHPGVPEFRGVLPSDRATSVGYVGAVSEVVATEGSKQRSTLNDSCLEKLIASVFHRVALLDPAYTELGIGVPKVLNMTDQVCVFNPGSGPVAGRAPEEWSGVFPKPDSVNVGRAMWSREAPDPVPEFASLGYPISVLTATSNALIVSKFTLTGPAGAVSVKLLTAANHPYVNAKHAHIVPNGALAKNTKYQVEFVGQVGNKTVSRTWSFTTVANDGHP